MKPRLSHALLALSTCCVTLTPAVAQPHGFPPEGSSSAIAGTLFAPSSYRTILGVGADETQATLSWRTSSSAPSNVQLYPAQHPELSREFLGTEQVGRALLYRSMETTLTDLEPSTEYRYRIGSNELGWSEEYGFTTGDGDGNWNFLAFADPQIGVGLKNAQQGDTWRSTISTATHAFPDSEMILSLGDQVDGWGLAQPQYDEFFSPAQLRSYPTGVIAGNHELNLDGMRHFEEHFSFPNEVGSSGNYYYVRNNVLFISLNSNLSSPQDIDRHRDFLRQVVEKHGATVDWSVVTYHHGPFSQASHVNDADVVTLREGLTPLLSELGVDLVLSGHDHIYTRSHLMKGTEAVVPGRRAEVGDELRHVEGQTLYITTTSAGGGKYYDFQDVTGVSHPGANRDTIDPALEQPWTALWNQDYTPDFLNVSVTPDTLRMSTYDITGTLIDDVTLAK